MENNEKILSVRIKSIGTFTESKEENLFISFLVENNVYALYMKNLAYVGYMKDCWNNFKKRNPANDWIISAFTWKKGEVPVGIEDSLIFWGDLNKKWKRIVRENF